LSRIDDQYPKPPILKVLHWVEVHPHTLFCGAGGEVANSNHTRMVEEQSCFVQNWRDSHEIDPSQLRIENWEHHRVMKDGWSGEVTLECKTVVGQECNPGDNGRHEAAFAVYNHLRRDAVLQYKGRPAMSPIFSLEFGLEH
jgi:hypothetical protein